MATLPAIHGLLKHQVYWRDPKTGLPSRVVQTFWTWRNEHPIPDVRVAYEVGAIKSWAGSTGTKALVVPGTYVDYHKAWDMGTSPPVRKWSLPVGPPVSGTGANSFISAVGVVVALRTQAVGAGVRNRDNGRLKHPFPSLGFLDGANGVWNATMIANAKTVYHALRDVLKPAASANSGTWVVPCIFEGGAVRSGGPLLPPVDHVIIRPLPGITRSRADHPTPYDIGT